MTLTRRILALAVLLAVAGPGAVHSAGPVAAFLAAADSLARGGDNDAFDRCVEQNTLLAGAAVAELLDRAARDPIPDADVVGLADRIARRHAALGGSETPLSLVATFRSWTADDLRRRREAKDAHERADGLRASQPAVALKLYKDILPVYESLGDAHSIALVWGGMGVAHWYLGDLQQVRVDYEKALAARRAVEDRILEGMTLNGLGSVNLQTGALADAVRFYSEACELRRRTGDVSGLGTSLTYLGHAYYKMGRLVDARDRYQEARPLLEAAGSPTQMVDLLNGIANCYSEMGRNRRANECYRDAAEIARANGNPDKEAHCRVNMADSFQRMGLYAEALVQLERVDSLLADAGDPELPALLHSTRGQVNVEIGALDDARRDFIAGVAAAEKLPDPRYLMDALINLAYLYGELGAFDRGLETTERARALAEKNASLRKYRNAVVIAANLHYADGDAEDALDNWKKALALDQLENVGAKVIEDRISIASILAALDRSDEAQQMFREISPQVTTPRLAVSFHLGLAHSFERTDPDSAAWHYEKALSVLESSRLQLGGDEARSSFLSGDRRFYFEEVARYYASRDHGEDGPWSARAFRTIERAKARSLLDLLAQAELSRTSASEETLLDRLHGGEDLGSDDLEARLATLQQERVDGALGRLGEEGTVADIDEVCSTMPAGAAMLQYALGDTASLLWVIDARGHHLEILPPRRDIEPLVQRFRDAIRRPGAGDPVLRESALSLFRMLVEPALPRLGDAGTLVVVPDGCLHGIPFEALLTEESDAGWDAQPYLVRRWTTVYCPSASIFARLEEHDPSADPPYGTDLVALGDPDFALLEGGGGTLAPLPHARTEVSAIAALADGARRDVRVGAEATEVRARTALLSVHPRILHLATHGIVDPAQPERSEVVLCPDPDGECDGHLRMMEIASMSGRAGLVVLSACESGMGKLSRGEGVIGLSRAFMAAGCGGTVASLWPVADESTAQLMQTFYEGMLGSREPAATALRDARLAMIDGATYAHPFFWSAFVLVGDHRSPW